jgi:hypothetical protein
MNVLKIDTNNLVDVSIPADSAYIDVDFVVPQDAFDSALSFSVESKFSGLTIVLTDPNNNIVTSDKSAGTYQFSPSPQANNSKWTFDKIRSPTPGKWTFRFSTSNGQYLEKLGSSITAKLSIGLFEKYTAFVKPFKTNVEVGQSLLILLRLSEYGIPSNIEGHAIHVLNRNSERVDTIYVSKQFPAPNGSLVAPSTSDYYAQYTAKNTGEFQFVSEFYLEQRDKPLKKRVNSYETLIVSESSVTLTSINFWFSDKTQSTASLNAIAKVWASRPIWLVVRLSFTLNGQPFNISRNIELLPQQNAQLNFNLIDIDLNNQEGKDLILKRIDLIDFDTNSDISLLRRYTPNLILKEDILFLPNNVEK